MAAYSKIDAAIIPSISGSSVSSSNSQISYGVSAFTVQAIASLKLPLIEIYTSVGYFGGNSNFDVKGNYKVTYNTGSAPPNNQVSTTVVDPVSLTYAASGVSNTWGVRVNLLFIKAYADYIFAKYNGVGVGVAFSIR